MKQIKSSGGYWILVLCGVVAGRVMGQGTAFTYQGQLQNNGSPASGTYNMTFTLFAASSDGGPMAGPVTNNGVILSNGLFTVSIDFGTGVFTGSTNWLQIGVKTNGSVAFTPLSPRQQLTPTPYAIFATTASSLSGTLPATQLSGALPASALTGNGSGLSGVNATSLNGQGATNFWQTTGNNLAAGQVLGSTNNQPLTLIANGLPAAVITPNAGGPEIVLGAAQNTINGSSSPGSSILGGSGNYVNTGSPYSVIGGGQSNSVTLADSFIGGGSGNVITYPYGVIGGGLNNFLSNSGNSVIGGGNGNTVTDSSGAVIGGGLQNTIANGPYGAPYAFLGGGQNNLIEDGANLSVLGGGYHNTNNAVWAFLGGGGNNSVSGNYGSVPGGYKNVAEGQYSFAAGQQAQANHQGAFVWADSQNAPFASTNSDSFNVRAQGGVRFVTGGAGLLLDGVRIQTNGAGGLSLPSSTGNGSGLTGLSATNFNPASGLVLQPATGNVGLGLGALANSGGGANDEIAIGAGALSGGSDSGSVAIGFDALQFDDAPVDNQITPSGTGENTAVGFQVLSSNRTGVGNTGLGYQALSGAVTNDFGTAVGDGALTGNSESRDTGVGAFALGYGSGAGDNTAIGAFALFYNGGSDNTADGFQALDGATGSDNTAIGYNALNGEESGNNNTADGANALAADGTGQDNTAAGVNALLNNSTGNDNTASGSGALYSNLNGSGNLADGFLALFNDTTGSNNVAAGNGAAYLSRDDNGIVAIGFQALTRENAGNNNVTESGNGENTAVGYQALGSDTTGVANTALGYEAGGAVTNDYNTAIGDHAMQSATGDYNTAIGDYAMQSGTGDDNTAIGDSAFDGAVGGLNTAVGGNTMLSANDDGAVAIGYGALGNDSAAVHEASTGSGMGENTAVGFAALSFNDEGLGNTALGFEALTGSSGYDYNTAVGDGAMQLGNGQENTAVGAAAMRNGSGFYSCALGYGALGNLLGGTYNIGIGYQAGGQITNGNNNIYIGSPGVAHDNNTIRIGTPGTQTTTCIAGIYQETGLVGTSLPVMVDSAGHLGTSGSSERFKQNIRGMADASEVLLSLRPVTFQYKPELDPQGTPQFGLVAEEVEKLNPALVAHDAKGNVFTVRYDAINAMLLNEFLKEHRQVADQNSQIQALEQNLQALEAIVGQLAAKK